LEFRVRVGVKVGVRVTVTVRVRSRVRGKGSTCFSPVPGWPKAGGEAAIAASSLPRGGIAEA
jgi:hypothetical protein